MTLRVTIEIVRHGDEDDKKLLDVLNISNIGLIEDKGFGHRICKYSVNSVNSDKDTPVLFVTHDRRDGFEALIVKALEKINRDCEDDKATVSTDEMLIKRLREGIDIDGIQDAEAVMDKAADRLASTSTKEGTNA